MSQRLDPQRLTSSDIDRDIEKYLAKGGKITVVPFGKSTLEETTGTKGGILQDY